MKRLSASSIGDRDPFDRLTFADSYKRMEVMADLWFEVQATRRMEWFKTLGEVWQVCDDISRWKGFLVPTLSEASEQERAAMMEPEERATWVELPEVLTVYRGCYLFNRQGLSWSLSRDVAARFPTLNRYRVEGHQPLLLTGRVKKARAVLKLGRNEQEIIAPRVVIVAREALQIPATAG